MKIKRMIVVICALMLMSACTSVKNISQNRKITAEQAKEMMDSQKVVVLDVRTLEEFNSGHIENAILIPDTDISSKAGKILTDKNAKILVYCRTGRRSKIASDELVKMGYTNVYDFGGITDWKYDIVTP